MDRIAPKMGLYRACNCCGEVYYVPRWRVKESRFCSMPCVRKSIPRQKRKGVFVICQYCRKEYYVSLSYKNKTKFCSKSCLNKGTVKAREPARLRAIVTHGMKGTPEYNAWCAMRARVKSGWWKDKGIQVFSAWINDFEAFYKYMGPIPKRGYTLDRYPNNLGNYEPGNVRWASKEEQGWSKVGKKIPLHIRRKMGRKGEANATSRLTDDQVREIRNFAGFEKSTVTAERFGIDRRTVEGIQKGESWKHVV